MPSARNSAQMLSGRTVLLPPRFATMLLLPVMVAGLVPGAPAQAAPPPAIANGQDVTQGRYGFAVKLTMTGIPEAGGGRRDSSCTGALVAPRWVITAGHCFKNSKGTHVSRLVAKLTTATAGRTDLSGTAGHKVKVIAVRQSSSTDVALAKLEKPITDITPARLNRKAPKVGAVVRLAGFGRTVDDDPASLATRMQTGQFKVASLTRGYVGMTGFAPRRSTSPCSQDSGGPYFTQQGDEAAVLVSVVSHGPSCPHSKVDQAGRIDTIYGWITGIVGKPAPATTKASPRPSQAPSRKPAAPNQALARNDQPGLAADPVVRGALAAIVIVGFGGVLALVLGNRSRSRARRRTGAVRRHRR
jgi:secreted trypsin-like serine protease